MNHHPLLVRIAALAGSATLAVLGLAAFAESSDGATAAAQSPTAQVWITTPDGTQKLHHAASATFSTSAPQNLTITIDPTRRFQRMTGFGASLTDSSATVLDGLSPRGSRSDDAQPVRPAFR